MAYKRLTCASCGSVLHTDVSTSTCHCGGRYKADKVVKESKDAGAVEEIPATEEA